MDFIMRKSTKLYRSWLGIACVISLVAVSSPALLNAQTEWKDNYVTLAVNDQTNPSIARPSNTEYTVIVWEDQRDGGKDIYAQKIDNVNGLPQWTPVDGVPVCTASYNQTNPRAAYESIGHVIIVWEDGRGTGSTLSIFAQCLNVSDGSVATNWQTNGIAVCDTSADARQPRIVGVAEGAFIVWVDSRNSLDVADSTNRDIYLQYLYSQTGNWPTGSGVAWRSCGILVSGDTTGLHDDCSVELAQDAWWKPAVDTKDKDGVVLVYESRRGMSGTGGADSIYFVYADSYDADGNWRWGSQDIRCATNDEEQLDPRVVVLGTLHGTGDSVAVIVWQDARENPTDNLYDIYGQVIEKHTGNIVGTVTGNAVCTADYTQLKPMVQTSKDNSVNVFWYDGRGASDLVMGTRLWGDTTGLIYWAKEKRERPETPPATIRLGEHYPNPLSLSRSSVSTIAVEVTAETEVSLKIYDNLGRERATVYEGVLTAGSHYLRFNAAGLRPGTYYYVLRGTDAIATRGIIILR
jgi:hypothetical protein